jgi:hypothetical protein
MKSVPIPPPTEKVVKSGSYFPLDDQKNNEAEVIYAYIVSIILL